MEPASVNFDFNKWIDNATDKEIRQYLEEQEADNFLSSMEH